MPVYEYSCGSCGKVHEVTQRFSDVPLKTCPDCGGRLKKLISNTSFILKGTGWYKTDYGTSSPSSRGVASPGEGAVPPHKNGNGISTQKGAASPGEGAVPPAKDSVSPGDNGAATKASKEVASPDKKGASSPGDKGSVTHS